MDNAEQFRPIDLSVFHASAHMAPNDGDDAPELLWVPIAALVFDDRYQRNIEQRGRSNILKIAKSFDWGRFTPLLVAPVNGGKLAVIDGQHRAHAAALRGHRCVPAMVCQMSLKEQAQAFAWVNGNVTAVSGFHIYRAALASEEPWAVNSQAAVAAAGCRLMHGNSSASMKKPRDLYCISTIRKLVDNGRAETVTRALDALSKSAQGDDVHMYSADVLGPWLSVVDQFHKVPTSVLVEFINANSFDSILRGVSKLRETPEHFRSSGRALFERSLVALFKKYMRERVA